MSYDFVELLPDESLKRLRRRIPGRIEFNRILVRNRRSNSGKVPRGPLEEIFLDTLQRFSAGTAERAAGTA